MFDRPIETSTALLLVDHGSRILQANQIVHQFVELLRLRRPGLLVRAAHMQLADPNISDAVADCIANGATEIVVSPYMLSPGRHADIDIPKIVLSLSAQYPQMKFRVSAPLGLHEKLIDIVLERANL